MRRLALVWLMALASALVAAGPAAAERRLALVVGINEYRSLPPLVRAAGDARAVGAALSGLGFETTTVIEADRARLDEAVAGFVATVASDDIVVVHFAGHGTRIGGDFRLLPADAPAPGTSRDALREAGGLGVIALADQIRNAGAEVQLVIVDACRGDPYAEGGAFQAGSACGALPRQPPDGTVVLFSAGTGQRALDRLGDNDRDTHSIFTRTLLNLLPRAATVPVVDLVRQVRDECAALASSVGHEQRPAYLDELQGSVTLVPAPAPRQREVVVASPPAPRPAPAPVERYAPQAPAPAPAPALAPVERYAPAPPPAPAPRRPSAASSCEAVAPGPPAFNCGRARTPVEVAICEDPGLGSCDRVMNRVFRNAERALGPQNSLERDRDAWLGRREACGRAADVNACIARVYEERIGQLERVVAQPPPTAVPAPPPSAPIRSAGPSFNCRYARSPVEIAICEDPGLAERDRQMARLFDRALSLDPGGAGDIDASQREWRAARDRCSRLASSQADAALLDCVARAYETRIRQLSGLAGGR